MSWRHIPAQVKATDDTGDEVSRQLPTFFQQEIDRVAMREGLFDTDEYLEGWSWSEPTKRDGDAEEVADAIAAEVADAWHQANPQK